MQPPAQEIVAKDLHGQSWTFRHIYRGTLPNSWIFLFLVCFLLLTFDWYFDYSWFWSLVCPLSFFLVSWKCFLTHVFLIEELCPPLILCYSQNISIINTNIWSKLVLICCLFPGIALIGKESVQFSLLLWLLDLCVNLFYWFVINWIRQSAREWCGQVMVLWWVEISIFFLWFFEIELL